MSKAAMSAAVEIDRFDGEVFTAQEIQKIAAIIDSHFAGLVEAAKTMVAVTAFQTGRTFNWDSLEKAETRLRAELEKVK